MDKIPHYTVGTPGSPRDSRWESEILGQNKKYNDQASTITEEGPGLSATEYGPSFTLEILCQFYFTLIYICTGNNKKTIAQQFGEFYLVLRIMHAVTNER